MKVKLSNIRSLFISGMNRVHPLVLDSKEDLIVLPLSSGQQYQLFTVATDNVGNQESLSEAMANMKTADYPSIVGVCPNNCSNRGNCTELSSCRCYPGFHGSDCSQSKCILSMLTFCCCSWSGIL